MAPEVSPLEYFNLPIETVNIQMIAITDFLPNACWIYAWVGSIAIRSSRPSASKNKEERSDSFLNARTSLAFWKKYMASDF